MGGSGHSGRIMSHHLLSLLLESCKFHKHVDFQHIPLKAPCLGSSWYHFLNLRCLPEHFSSRSTQAL